MISRIFIHFTIIITSRRPHGGTFTHPSPFSSFIVVGHTVEICSVAIGKYIAFIFLVATSRVPR